MVRGKGRQDCSGESVGSVFFFSLLTGLIQSKRSVAPSGFRARKVCAPGLARWVRSKSFYDATRGGGMLQWRMRKEAQSQSPENSYDQEKQSLYFILTVEHLVLWV